MNARLGNVHRLAQGDPHFAWAHTRLQRVGGRQIENVEHEIANEGLAHRLTEFALNRARELGVLHTVERNAREDAALLGVVIRVDGTVFENVVRHVVGHNRHDVANIGHLVRHGTSGTSDDVVVAKQDSFEVAL